MADLTEAQKREIVEALAGFQSSSAIITHFRSVHGLDLTHKQVGRYDPTRPYYEGGERWREIFEAHRKAYLEDVSAIPAAHKAYRLNMLQEGIDAARAVKNWVVMAQLLKQAAEEVGGALTNERNLRVDDARVKRARDMTPEERQAALTEIIRRALEERKEQLAAKARQGRLEAPQLSVAAVESVPAVA
ncbi:MAG: hypothetical protein BGO08_10100 [Altererythrobacter sp. 66-12]|nr:MAG: hypothetical protein BGO08_10100 [Altererythrobacter sp. 66-12]